MSEDRAGFRRPSQGAIITVGDMADARDEGYADGFTQGKNEGYDAGYKNGQIESQRTMDLELTKIRQLIAAMQHPLQDFQDTVMKALKSLSIHVCEVFLCHSLAQDTQLLEHLVDEAIKQLLPTDQQVAVHVNAHNSDVIQRALESHLEESAWRIQINNKLSDGNIFLESGFSKVQIDVHDMLQQYLLQLQDLQ